jgi:hypothetical protein
MEISFSKIISQVKEVILNPKDFWISKKETKEDQMELLAGYFFPILVLVAVIVFLGEFFRSTHFYMGYAVLKAVREVILFVLEYYLAVFFTTELMKTFGSEKNIVAARKLVVYSFTPLLLVSMVTGLFPFLYVLDILGLYSFYIFWVGVGELLVFPEQKQSSYAIITIVVNFFVFSFLSIFLSKLLTAYF